MKATKYEDLQLNGYEVYVAKEEDLKGDGCDFLLMFHADEHDEYVSTREVDGKTLVGPIKTKKLKDGRIRIPTGSSFTTCGSEWIIYGFQVTADGLRLYVYNSTTNKTDIAHIAASSIENLKCQFVLYDRSSRVSHHQRQYRYSIDDRSQYSVNIEQRHTSKHAGEEMSELHVVVHEFRNWRLRRKHRGVQSTRG